MLNVLTKNVFYSSLLNTKSLDNESLFNHNIILPGDLVYDKAIKAEQATSINVFESNVIIVSHDSKQYWPNRLLIIMGIIRKSLNWYAKLSPTRGKSSPPFDHVVQIGDPTLRKISEPVPHDKIKTSDIQTIIKKLEFVLNKYGSVGMSAPQIGVNMRIFVMRHTAQDILSVVTPEVSKRRGMSVVPFTVFVNPVMKIVDYRKVIYPEGCESIRSFSADVARFKEVNISGYNAEGEATSQTYRDWPARIVQHEMDHLDGKLYTDVMDRKSLQCTCWEEVNLCKGKIVIPFAPE